MLSSIYIIIPVDFSEHCLSFHVNCDKIMNCVNDKFMNHVKVHSVSHWQMLRGMYKVFTSYFESSIGEGILPLIVRMYTLVQDNVAFCMSSN